MDNNPLKGISAEDVFKHVYSNTIMSAVSDLDKQVDDFNLYIKPLGSTFERTKLQDQIDELTKLIKALLQFHMGAFQGGKERERLCNKYDVVTAIIKPSFMAQAKMTVHGDEDAPLNFGIELKPLFDALKNGQTVKSITCMKGTANKDDRSKDFKIENVKASDYWVGIGYQEQVGYFDYVDTYGDRSFYMNWVLSYELE